jgi:hypothetical protein
MAGAVAILILGLFAGLIAGGITWGAIAAKRRRQALAAVAKELGLAFSFRDPTSLEGHRPDPGPLAGLLEEYLERAFAGQMRPGWSGLAGDLDRFEPLAAGDTRRAYNVLRGRRGGRELSAFDYRYGIGSGVSRRTCRFSVAIAHCGCSCPELIVRPEGLLDKLAGAVGAEDIDFESQEFSKRFHVACADRKFAYAVIHAQTMEFLLGGPGWSPGWTLEMDGEDVAIWSPSRWSPEEFRSAIAVLEGFVDRIPRYLRKDLGPHGAGGG